MLFRSVEDDGDDGVEDDGDGGNDEDDEAEGVAHLSPPGIPSLSPPWRPQQGGTDPWGADTLADVTLGHTHTHTRVTYDCHGVSQRHFNSTYS